MKLPCQPAFPDIFPKGTVQEEEEEGMAKLTNFLAQVQMCPSGKGCVFGMGGEVGSVRNVLGKLCPQVKSLLCARSGYHDDNNHHYP